MSRHRITATGETGGGERFLKKKCIVGTWANIRNAWMLEHQPEFYRHLEESGELIRYLDSFQDSYEIQAVRLADKLAAERGITPELAESNFSRWVIGTIKIQEDVTKELTRRICR